MNLLTVLKVMGIGIVLYAITATVLLLLARLEKDKEGNIIIDPESWHFKMAYPFQKYSKYFRDDMREKGTSLCLYTAKLVTMLYIGWPIIIAWEGLKTIIYTPFAFLFGYYAVPGLQKYAAAEDHAPTYQELKKINLPKIRNVKILPIHIVLPAVYVWFLINHPKQTFNNTLVWVFIVIVAVVISLFITSLVELLRWTQKTDVKTVSLVREFLIAKKKRVCPPVKIK